MRSFKALAALLFIGPCLLAALVFALYGTVSESNTTLDHFDTIIVLGSPANPDGTPSLEQRERALEGAREYQAGVAPRIIMTGGAAHNQYVEAQVMARLAEQQGVSADALIEEARAMNTIQNAYYSVEIMRVHNWHSAEVVSSPSHLPRASLIFSHFPIEWRMHAAPWPKNYLRERIWALYTAEGLYCTKLRLFGFPASRYLGT